ncbi:MAG: DNA polymerase III subunit delta [Candidatus Peribacteraceae bacterium]|nr:DNA polymerase III subunit delta [Candidatus Peribacteraceae bacterium]
MGKIFLFTGENRYALRQEVSRWMREFREKHGEENISRLEARDLSVASLLDEVASAPFISQFRLILLEGIPSFSKEEVALIADSLHPQALLLLVDPAPDRRLAATKEFLKIAEVKTFLPLRGQNLFAWMRTMLEQCGGRASEEVLGLLLGLVGEDQEALSQELRKLALFCGERPVTREDIDLLVVPSAEQAVWRLMDLLGEGKSEELLRYSKSLLDRGESPASLWNILLWMTASLVGVTCAVQEGVMSPDAIVKAAGVKFNAARSLLPLARRSSPAGLRAVVARIAERDIGLKTGAFRSTAEAPEELEAIVDSTLAALAEVGKGR